jgi:hypothetical protein
MVGGGGCRLAVGWLAARGGAANGCSTSAVVILSEAKDLLSLSGY